jgi:thiol-disulfide isomerase/thioredoxin
MKLLLFGKETCEACKKVKEKLNYYHNKYAPIEICYYDVDTVDGLAESAYRSVAEIPTVILVDQEQELKRWVQSAPTFAELDSYFRKRVS